MWFSLFAVVLILAITFYQGLLGLFSAAITCILALLSAALAFGLYEDVYHAFLLDRQPGDGRATALIAIFVISLLVLRVVFDQMIKGNQQFPLYVDRAGGGVFGFITAMVIIGTLATGVQMLSFPETFLGFTRYRMYNADGSLVSMEPTEEKQPLEEVLGRLDFTKMNYRRQSLWFNPDGFAVALASHLSANALHGRSNLGAVHPELLDDLHWARFNPFGQKVTAVPKSDVMRVEAVWTLGEDELYVLEPADPKATPGPSEARTLRFAKPTDSEDRLPGGDRWLVVRVKLDSDACDESSTFRFTPQQVRLVTQGTKPREYYAVGINAIPENLVQDRDKRRDWHYRVYEGQSIVRPMSSTQGRFDFVFEIPEDVEPWFIEYKRNARAEVRAAEKEAPESLAAEQGPRKSGPSPRAGNNQQSDSPPIPPGEPGPGIGRIARVHANTQGSFFSQELPFKLTNYNVVDGGMEIANGRIRGGPGRLIAPLTKDDEPEPGNEPPVEGFDVPDNNRLLHLSVTNLTPGSLYGQVSDFAAQNNNCGVIDAQGRTYPAIGMYAIATVRGRRLFELVYFDELNRMGSAAIPKLQRIKRTDLKQNYELYYLFEVPPGTRVTRFRNPRNKEEGLSAQNLVAPQ